MKADSVPHPAAPDRLAQVIGGNAGSASSASGRSAGTDARVPQPMTADVDLSRIENNRPSTTAH